MSGGGGSSEQTTKQEPWQPQQQYIKDVYKQSADLYRNNQTTPYEFDRTAPQSANTTNAQDYLTGYGTSIAPAQFDKANEAFTRNLNAQDIANNTYLNDAVNAATDPINRNLTTKLLPQIGSAAIKQGAYGGGRQGVLESEAVRGTNEVIANARSKFFGDAYQKGVNTSLQATNQANQINKLGLAPGNIAAQVGAQQDAYNQKLIDDSMARYYENFQFPWQDLAQYNQNIRGNVGGTTTSPGPQGPSRGQAALSGAAAGASFGPWGAAIGGAAGAILGG